jgi:3-hydroxy acid dehydrogenase / malonic semialdehyde reductase
MSRAVAFVTGASGGIGAAVARRLAKGGASIVLAARRTERLETLAQTLEVPAHVVTLDVSKREEVCAAVAELPPEFADVDVLVNCAGGALGLEPAYEASLDDWGAMIGSNVEGVVHVTRALLPGMVARDRGHIVNIGSVAGTYPYPGGNVYGAAKAFVAQCSLNLRADLIGKNVRVSLIEPGMVETDFSLFRFKGDAEKAAAVYRGLHALGADDIANAVQYCVAAPPHVNVNRLELMPTMQAFGPFVVKRDDSPP